MATITAEIQLNPAQFEILSNESTKKRISISDLVSHLVQSYLLELAMTRQQSSGNHMSIVGLGDSGANDISENHDRYLGEALANEHLR